MQPRLELIGLSKRFDDVQAVDGLSLALAPGEFLSLLGPSGCGKSTTMSMIAGFTEPDDGDILVGGESIARLAPRRRRVGLVFQDYAVFTKLTVRANLAFGLEAQRVRRDERKRRVAEMAKKLDLEAVLDRRGAALNMSEMQRVALGRVLITEPQLLLLDEPMSNLDASIRARLRGELKRIQKELNQTVLYVTHDQVEAMSMSDRIAVMDRGVLLQVGTPEEIYHAPANRFVAEFIGDPPINIVPCELRRNGAVLAADTAVHKALPIGEAPIGPGAHELAIRPHDIRVDLATAPDSAPGVVRFIENFGSERVLHVAYGDALIRAVVTPSFGVAPEATVHLSFDTARLVVVERGTGRCVLSGGARAA